MLAPSADLLILARGQVLVVDRRRRDIAVKPSGFQVFIQGSAGCPWASSRRPSSIAARRQASGARTGGMLAGAAPGGARPSGATSLGASSGAAARGVRLAV